MVDLIGSATTEIIVVGYRISSGAAPILMELREASVRGVSVTIVAQDLEVYWNVIASAWRLPPYPKLFTFVRNDETSTISLHAKAIIVDRQSILITSANLTLHGLHDNIEFGVLSTGQAALSALSALEDLVSSGMLRELHHDSSGGVYMLG